MSMQSIINVSFFSRKNLISFVLFSIWLTLFFYGVVRYQGAWYVYTVFSLAFLLLLLSGLCWKVTYGYIFLAVIFWLGFWLKTVTHLLIDYPFEEPVGLFSNTGAEWDAVLVIASLGAVGIIIGRLIYHGFFGRVPTMTVDVSYPQPTWYKQYKVSLWSAIAIAMIVFSVLNMLFSFQQIGLVPRTIIWPLNALTFWLQSTGFAMAVATLLWWEVLSKKGNINTVYFVLFEATTSSISLLSRGLYIFHIIPLFFSLFINRRHLYKVNLKWASMLLSSCLLLFLLCYPIVNSVRDYYYSSVPLTMPWQPQEKSSTLEKGMLLEKGILKLAKFSVDRWIGIEGLMATSAHPDKNLSLFLSAAVEKGSIGKASIFQEIALSHYRFMDLNKFVFATLPGPVSFFYLSGSSWLVVIGMAILSFLVLTSERLLYKFLPNPFLAALWGSILATTVGQMGVNIPGLIFYLFLCSLGILTLYLFQHSFFVKHFPLGKHKS